MTDPAAKTSALSETCEHRAIQAYFSDPYTGGDGTSMGMWACADCRVRFYPACPVCVDVGHRDIDHPATPPTADLHSLVDDMGEFILLTIPEKGWFNRKWTSARRHLLDRWAALSDASSDERRLLDHPERLTPTAEEQG